MIKPKKWDKRTKIDWIIEENRYTLTIETAELADAGEYALQAENQHGGFTLKVNVMVKKAEEDLEETKIEHSILTKESSKVEETQEGSLVLSESVKVESKEESEMAVEAVETKESAAAGAPNMIQPPDPVVLGIGETITLSCKVTGQHKTDPSVHPV